MIHRFVDLLGGGVIPYVHTSGGNNRVAYVTAIPGQDETLLSTATANVVLSPIVSPDETMIAWRQAGDLYVINVDGTGQTKLYDSTLSTGPNGNMRVNGLDWAKDSSHILFGITDAGTDPAYYNLSTVEPDGSNLATLYSDATRRVGLPSYNYDGTKIAFWAYSSGTTRLLRTADADGTNVATAATVTGTGVLGDVQDYAWAQTQNKLAYRSTGTTYRIVNHDGTGDTSLGSAGTGLVWRCWAPDDSAIYYSDTSFLTNLRKIATDGSGSSLVYTDSGSHGHMCLVTNGRVYRSGTHSGPVNLVESVSLDGSDFRTESSGAAYSMF